MTMIVESSCMLRGRYYLLMICCSSGCLQTGWILEVGQQERKSVIDQKGFWHFRFRPLFEQPKSFRICFGQPLQENTSTQPTWDLNKLAYNLTNTFNARLLTDYRSEKARPKTPPGRRPRTGVRTGRPSWATWRGRSPREIVRWPQRPRQTTTETEGISATCREDAKLRFRKGLRRVWNEMEARLRGDCFYV